MGAADDLKSAVMWHTSSEYKSSSPSYHEHRPPRKPIPQILQCKPFANATRAIDDMCSLEPHAILACVYVYICVRGAQLIKQRRYPLGCSPSARPALLSCSHCTWSSDCHS